jgi:hypothetical protein
MCVVLCVSQGDEAESGHYITFLRQSSDDIDSSTCCSSGSGVREGTTTETAARDTSSSTSSDICSDDICNGRTASSARKCDGRWVVLNDARPPRLVSTEEVMATAVTGGGAYILGYNMIDI